VRRFIALEKLINLHDGYQRAFRIDSHSFMLVQVAGTPVIFEPVCPHAGWSMVYARIQNGRINCPKHDFSFDLISGEIVSPPGIHCEALKQFPVEYQGTQIGVWVD
jgi:nitrite reductase/ring-hydroxylating ferredoxin subunit